MLNIKIISIFGTCRITLPGTTPHLASVAGRQEGIIMFNSKWKCNQMIMKVSQVSGLINLHFNPVFMVHGFNSARE